VRWLRGLGISGGEGCDHGLGMCEDDDDDDDDDGDVLMVVWSSCAKGGGGAGARGQGAVRLPAMRPDPQVNTPQGPTPPAAAEVSNIRTEGRGEGLACAAVVAQGPSEKDHFFCMWPWLLLTVVCVGGASWQMGGEGTSHRPCPRRGS
jgi:hypothetical protein